MLNPRVLSSGGDRLRSNQDISKGGQLLREAPFFTRREAEHFHRLFGPTLANISLKPAMALFINPTFSIPLNHFSISGGQS